ncbi:Tol-Pal system beta propeller repeat protein TolB [Aliikangiella coralliicola]|uniref:Tol-Pal system protein TolB n=1 Tax=Aliikangiella coralliicola TaxID=2592383 RepID=A0A545UBT5_9GAMM|nr:Tol-Pal system beta propeller repeat protein TolB [Aliikangiella coralliicola]TQV86917.1 Tol-Pal system protein TolB [Aliikangiella coralliicola]
MKIHYKTVLSIIAFFICGHALAEEIKLDFVISEGIDSARPIAVLPFSWKGVADRPLHDVSSVVGADLRRSGRFNPMARHELVQQVDKYQDVNLELWREKGIEAVVVGNIEEQPDGRLKVGYELVDIFRKQQEVRNGELVNVDRNRLDSYTAFVNAKDLRFHAHRIADRVYEKLTGERGAFATKIAYVSVDRSQTKPYRLMVADSDGFAPQTIFASTQPIMSPAWSPDAKKLAYVSFENGRSEVYIQDIYIANSRKRVAAFEGINSAPAFSPDGRRLALTLSRDGNPEIYVLDLTSHRFSRITKKINSIETEPSWTPDGQSLLFTSDRGRGPQIYKQNLASNRAQRVTWEGNYNASAALTPDGKTMVLINRTNGIFHVAVQDVETNTMQTLTKTSLDESPSLAPNGSMVIYATVYRNRQVLSVVSTDGRFKARLPSRQGEVKAPVWSPYLN